jgi:hypothetical protein
LEGKKVPTDVPFLNIAGDGDPVGDFGNGVKENKDQVIDDIISFLQTL